MNLQERAVERPRGEGEPRDNVDDGDQPHRAIKRNKFRQNEERQQERADGHDDFRERMRQERAELQDVAHAAARADDQPGDAEGQQ